MQIVTFPAKVAVLLVAAIFLIFNFSVVQSSPLSAQHELNFPESSNQETYVEEETTPTTSTTTSSIPSYVARFSYPHFFNRNSTTMRPWINVHQSEQLMLLEGAGNDDPAECCPTILETTSPIGGINAEGNYVQLYAEGDKKQQFHEVSCRDDILDQPCRYMERRFHNRSRCVQKYSYSYAVVLIQPEDDDETRPQTENEKLAAPFGTEKFMLDHIQIRSGCSCEITPNKKIKLKKDKKNKKRGKKESKTEGT